MKGNTTQYHGQFTIPVANTVTRANKITLDWHILGVWLTMHLWMAIKERQRRRGLDGGWRLIKWDASWVLKILILHFYLLNSFLSDKHIPWHLCMIWAHFVMKTKRPLQTCLENICSYTRHWQTHFSWNDKKILNLSGMLTLKIKASEMLVAPRISECFGLGLL